MRPFNDIIYLIEDEQEEKETDHGYVTGTEGLPITGSGVVYALPERAADALYKDVIDNLKVGDHILYSKYAAEEVHKEVNGKRIERLKSVHASAIHAKDE